MSNSKQILHAILDYAIAHKASDVHMSAGKAVVYRVSKIIRKMKQEDLVNKDNVQEILLELMNNNPERVKEFLQKKDADFAYQHHDWTSFRVNVFMKLGRISFVMRRIESTAMELEKLWLPPGVKRFITAKQWLILITWPTWSWKSTTMVSILNEINKSRWEHILTIEDPVEFVFTDNKSIFSQREVWNDTSGFTAALRASLREDPDVIMIGEMRDRETVEAALELAETGHLVISTMHTSWSVQTITRLINFFPSDIQNSIQYKLWDLLNGVLSQRLVQKADGSGIIGIFELMHMNIWIKGLIREWTLNQIKQNIEMGKKDGMMLMKQYAEHLEEKWIITRESYIDFFQDEI